MSTENTSITRSDASTESTIPSDVGTSTPPATPLTQAQQAYALALSNQTEIKDLRNQINNPQWTKDFITSQKDLNRIIKISLWLFLSLLLLLILIFFICSIFQMNSLMNVLGDIRDSKKMEVNDSLLLSFNELFYHCKRIANFFASVIGSLALISVLTLLLSKAFEQFTKSIRRE